MTQNPDRHNGIPLHFALHAGPTQASLYFGVGMRNEPPHLAGITHIAEHIILSMVHPLPQWHGGSVTEDAVEFHVFGRVDEVAQVLNRVAEAVRNFETFSDHMLAVAKAGIEAENPVAYERNSAGLATNRFGATGLGMSQLGAPTTLAITRPELVSWVREWFTAQNAAIKFAGPSLASLDVVLPAGQRIERVTEVSLSECPKVVLSPKEGVALSLIVPTHSAKILGEAVRSELLERLDSQRGLIYSVDVLTTHVDASTTQIDWVLDPTFAKTRRTFIAAVESLNELATDGPSEFALLRAQRHLEAELAWDINGYSFEYLGDTAINRLLNRPSTLPQEQLTRANSATVDELREVLDAAMGSLIVAVDRDVPISTKLATKLGLTLDRQSFWDKADTPPVLTDPQRCDEPAQADDGPVATDLEGTRWKHRGTKETLTITGTQMISTKPKRTLSVRLEDVVLVGNRTCGCVALLNKRGESTEISTENWKRGKRLKIALLAAFPVEIVRNFPER